MMTLQVTIAGSDTGPGCQSCRKLIAKKYDSSGRRRRIGRPPTQEELRDLVIRMAEENRGWGYTPIRGAMANLGHELGRGTIAEILKQAGLEPACGPSNRSAWIG